MSGQVAATRLANEASQGGTLIKLIIFALSLALVPLSTYFGTLDYVWKGDSTFAAISAVFAANIVLVAYIALSVYEDKGASNAGNSEKVKTEDSETRKKK